MVERQLWIQSAPVITTFRLNTFISIVTYEKNMELEIRELLELNSEG